MQSSKDYLNYGFKGQRFEFCVFFFVNKGLSSAEISFQIGFDVSLSIRFNQVLGFCSAGFDGLALESFSYVLRDCYFAEAFWIKLVPALLLIQFFSMNFEDWLLCNLKNRLHIQKNMDWVVIFGNSYWISRLPTKWGLFQAYYYRSKLDGT